jgi:glycosyltransferase involved in cell wall biosynthesis
LSSLLHNIAHRVKLFVESLCVGIINLSPINLWFLSPLETNSKIISSRQSETWAAKQNALRLFKRKLIKLSGTIGGKGPFVWLYHPLVTITYKSFSFLGLRTIFITKISSSLFNKVFYLDKYPEVRNHNESLLSHYLIYGFFFLYSPSDGVFNQSPQSDWKLRDVNLSAKRSYLYDQAKRQNLLISTDVDELKDEASKILSTFENRVQKIDTTLRGVVESERGSEPKVSVIIPCFEQGSFLKECLVSIAEATSELHECIIIDDGNSQIEELELLKSVKPTANHQEVYVYRQENSGVAGARNSGLSLARGKYIKFLDADDLLLSDSIDRQLLEIKRTNSDADIGGFQVVDSDLQKIAEDEGPIQSLSLNADNSLNPNTFLASWEESMAIPIHSLLVSKNKCKPINSALRSKEDLRLWLELAESGVSFSTSTGITALYRQHDKQTTSKNRAQHGLYFLESLFDLDISHPNLIDKKVLRDKVTYIQNFYGSAPLDVWAAMSNERKSWIANL